MPGRLSEIAAAALGCLLALMACQGILPSSKSSDPAPLAVYRDSVLDLDMQYPPGWVPQTKKTPSYTGKTYDVFFEPPNTLATRRFTVKIIVPDHIDSLRTLGDFKAEFVERLSEAGSDIRMVDSGSAVMGGEPAFEAEYQTFLDGKPYVRVVEIICLRNGRDIGLIFETSESTADDDLLLFARVVDGFGFYSR